MALKTTFSGKKTKKITIFLVNKYRRNLVYFCNSKSILKKWNILYVEEFFVVVSKISAIQRILEMEKHNKQLESWVKDTLLVLPASLEIAVLLVSLELLVPQKY